VGGALSLLIAAAISLTLLSAWVPRMVSYAVGVLLAAAFLELIPQAVEQVRDAEPLFAVVLAGVLAFFLMEKAALWRHRHEASHAHGGHGVQRAGALVIIGDGFHNFVDGVLIAAAFMADVHVGIIAAAAIVAHEIPQEIGDFMVLLRAGYSRGKALAFNLASSLASVVGGLVGYFLLDAASAFVPYILALAAASFIYVAVADLIPDLHTRNDGRSTIWQVALIALGLATIALPHALLHQH
jgi:zinc and cadmium transporter